MPESHAGIAIGFIGAGRMASALAKGINSSPGFANVGVFFTDPGDDAAAVFQSGIPRAIRCDDLKSLADQSGLLLLAVKPQVMPQVLTPLAEFVRSDHLVVSVAAGISIESMEKTLGTDRIIRVMPNTPCLIGQGMSAMAPHPGVRLDDQDSVRKMLESVGKVAVVQEADMDAVTGLSGSGPAYVFQFIQALIAGGVAQGLSPETAKLLTVQTVLGAARLVECSDRSPAELTTQVTSPGGTTLAGLEQLQAGEFPIAVKNAIAAATRRSIELSQT